MLNSKVTIAMIPCVSQRADLQQAQMFFEHVKEVIRPWGADLWDIREKADVPYIFNQKQLQSVLDNLQDVDGLFFAKSIDGVYDDDPATNPEAKKIDVIKAEDIVKNNLKVIDMAAANLCFERKIPVIIFGLNEENSIVRAVGGEKIGTIVTV